MKPFWETQEPDYTNELGIKWYVDRLATRYALQENLNGVCLKDVIAYATVFPDGEVDLVLVRNGQVIYSTKSLESLGFEIDKLKAVKGLNT